MLRTPLHIENNNYCSTCKNFPTHSQPCLGSQFDPPNETLTVVNVGIDIKDIPKVGIELVNYITEAGHFFRCILVNNVLNKN